LIQAYDYHERLETRRAEEFQANLELARAAAQAFETFVNDIIHQELSIGLALTSSQSLTEEDRNRILNGSKKGNPAIWEVFWSRPNGIVIAATGPQFIGMNLEDRDYFREVVSGHEWTVSDLLLSRTTGRPSFTISRGIRSDTGQLLGIVVAGILPEQLDHILAIKRSKGGGHALVDRKGMLVYRYPTINLPTWEQRNWLRDYPEFGVALNGNEVSKTVFAPFEGKNRIVSFAPVSFIGWAAGAGRTEDIVVEAITSRLIPQVVLFLLVTFGAFSVAVVLSRFISLPVKRLRDHALVLGRGGTNDPAAAAGPAELRELADAFNSMAEQLRSRETNLRDQREWFSVTLTSIGDAVLTTDTEGRITLLNPVASGLTGWKLEEALGQPVQNIFHIINEQTREPEENIVDRVLRAGCGIALANHAALVRRIGREVPIEDSAAPIKDATGKVFGVVLVFHDVTERRLTLDRLRESEERFRVMANSIPQLARIAEADGYIFRYNQRWYDYTGTKPEQMQGWGWQSVHDQEALPSVRERWENSIATGWPFEMVFPITGRRRQLREFLTRVMPVKNANGDVIRWCGTNTDITERKRAEEALLESEARFRLLSMTSARLLAAEDPQAIIDELCTEVMNHLECQVFFNFLLDEAAGRLHLNAYAGVSEEEAEKLTWLDYGVAVCGCAARDAVRIVAEDIFNVPDVRTELVKSYGVQAYACQPLMAQGRVIGTLSFGTKTRTRFSLQDLSLMNTIADQVAIATERVRLMGELERSRDELEMRVRTRTAELVKANTELEGIERALRSSENNLRHNVELLQMVVDGITDPLIMLDKEGCVTMINKAAMDYYGTTMTMDFPGRPCFVGLKRRESACPGCDYPFPSVEDHSVTVERKGLHDSRKVESVTVYPVLNESGQRDTVIVKTSDVTQVKLLERQILHNEKLASLGLMTSGTAHEINNPNTFIYFNIPILKMYLQELMPILDDYAALHPDFEVLHMSYGDLTIGLWT
jgi:PAS domain S-box-containing protein